MIYRKLRVAALLGGLLVAVLASYGAGAGPASATIYPCFAQLPGLAGIPPWGFHTSDPLAGTSGWYSRAYGDINLDTDQISGKLCLAHFVKHREQLITMAPKSPVIYHTHTGVMWGYAGNIVKARVKVTSSTARSCKVGTVGTITMFASYNGVRSDSVQYAFPKSCHSENHTYHGSQVNAQVPPL